MEMFTIIIGIVVIVLGILQIILFFKMWEMAGNVERLCSKVCYNEEPEKPHKIKGDTLTTIIVCIVILAIIIYVFMKIGF